MQKWEYKIHWSMRTQEGVDRWAAITNVLNGLGDEGWEVVAMLHLDAENQSFRAVLKRPKPRLGIVRSPPSP